MDKYTITEHLLELKKRIIRVITIFLIFFGICYFYSESIYQLILHPLALISPLGTRKIIYTGLAEAFFTYLKIASFTAFLITWPFICSQIYGFVAPGLLKQERYLVSFILFFSPLLFYSGGLFVFYLVMPNAWYFFLSFENNGPIPLILEARISEYLTIVIQLIIAFGLAFQMPIILLLLKIMNIITVSSLKKRRKLAIIINFILAAVFTPPDVFSQIMLAIPLLLLYEISIIICSFSEKRRVEC